MNLKLLGKWSLYVLLPYELWLASTIATINIAR